MPSSLNVENTGDVTVVGFTSESLSQAAAVEQTAKELYAVVEQDGARKVVIDFANVSFLSSQALGMMLTLRLKAAKTGAALVLANVRSRFGEILALTNLDKLFTIFDSREAALGHLRGA
jgi:anti-sigma B factor antagonist